MGIFRKKKKKKKESTSGRLLATTETKPTINSPGPKPLVVKRNKPMYEKAIDRDGGSASIWNLSETPRDSTKVAEYYKKSLKSKKRGGMTKGYKRGGSLDNQYD